MPLSLALFSDMVGISAMAIMSHWIIGLVWFPIPSFGIFQSNGAEIFDVENHKRKFLFIKITQISKSALFWEKCWKKIDSLRSENAHFLDIQTQAT